MQSVSITTKVVSSNSTVEISLDKPSKTFSAFVVNFSSEYFGVSHIIVKIKNLKTLVNHNWKWWVQNSSLFVYFNATFNNISATCISWRSVWLVEETEGHRENHRPVASHCQTLSHNVVLLALSGIPTHNISVDRYRLHK